MVRCHAVPCTLSSFSALHWDVEHTVLRFISTPSGVLPVDCGTNSLCSIAVGVLGSARVRTNNLAFSLASFDPSLRRQPRRADSQEFSLLAGNAGSSDKLGVWSSQRVASKSVEGIRGQSRGVAVSGPLMTTKRLHFAETLGQRYAVVFRRVQPTATSGLGEVERVSALGCWRGVSWWMP